MENRILTLPNVITTLRLLLAPVFVVVFVVLGQDMLGFLVFVIAAGTDWIDGYVARKTHSISELGKILDPLVDRILLGVGVICLCVVGRLPLIILILLLLKDFVLLCLSAYMKKRYNSMIRVVYIGKVATAVLMVAFASIMLNWPHIPYYPNMFEALLYSGQNPQLLGVWISYLGIVLAWIACFVYLYRGIRFGNTIGSVENGTK